MITILKYSVKRHVRNYIIETSVGTWPLPRGQIPINNDPFDIKYYSPDQRISEELLKDDWLYYIKARNSCVGIYNYDRRCFTIARTKFNHTYLFDEYDWNTGNPYGTAVPIEMIEKIPSFRNDDEKLLYLLRWRKKLSYVTTSKE